MKNQSTNQASFRNCILLNKFPKFVLMHAVRHQTSEYEICTLYFSDCSFQKYTFGITYLLRKQNFSKNLHIHTCAYQGVRNVSFSENFATY